MDYMSAFGDYIIEKDFTVLDVIKDFAETNGFKVPIKGGLALNYLYDAKEPSARNTVDIDYHFIKQSEWDDFKNNAVINATNNSKLGITYNVVKEKINPNGSSITIEFNSKILNGKFKVDMNYGDYCKTIDLGKVILYSPEMIIADKLSVLCSEIIQRRCKDLYDIYLIINNEDFELDKLCYEIKEKMKSRGTKFGNLSLLNPEILYNLKVGYRKIKLIDMPEFEEVCKLDLRFILPILASINTDADKIAWDKDKKHWDTNKIYGSIIGKDLIGVISKETASGMLNLSTFPPFPVIVSNSKIDLDMGIVKFIINEYDDKDLIKLRDNLFITSKERTIIDMLEDGEYRILMESIETYLDENGDLEKLEEMAKECGKLNLLKEVLVDIRNNEIHERDF